MSSVLNVKLNKKPCYDIMFEKSFTGLADKLKELEYKGKKCCIITDSNVQPLYAEKVEKQLLKVFADVYTFTFPAGEESKNIDTVRDAMKFLVENGFKRGDVIAALGGGVVGDLSGFTASIYMRGIDFIQIPTTLLACVDSSVGGKTGVDFDGYKNMMGAFKMPRLVYINTKTLTTLTARQYYSGMAEVLKYGLIMDGAFYEWLLGNMYGIFDLEPAVLEEMIERCCELKARVVEADPYENGLRRILNLGHTIGHAIEKYKNFELHHGECVALGTVCAAYISWKKNLINMDDYYEIRDMFVPFNLPITVTDIDPQEIVKLTHSDKKATSTGINFVLLKKVGKAVVQSDVTDEEMLDAIAQIHFTDDDLKE